MLLRVPPLIPPEMLKLLCEMGHGSEFIIADANFPAVDYLPETRILYLPGLNNSQLLGAVLEIFPLDSYGANVILMQPCPGHEIPDVWARYRELLHLKAVPAAAVEECERFAFYERAKRSYFAVVTGEQSPYANLILKKGEVR